MTPSSFAATAARPVLQAETAADLMTPNPASLREGATIREAVRFLTDRGFSAVPVVDYAGRAVGVLSRADIVRHDRDLLDHPEIEVERSPHTEQGENLPGGFQVERVDRTRIRDLMTPVVLSVLPETPAGLVAARMVALKVHRLFVVDHQDVLIGVVSATDVLRRLRPMSPDSGNAATTDVLPARLSLGAETARELMTPSPVSIRAEATVAEAVKLLTERRFSAAPVIDRAGRPVGVVSQADILVYDRESVQYIAAVPDYYEPIEMEVVPGDWATAARARLDAVRVRDIMTPVVFSVAPEEPAENVIECLRAWKVHRVFVIDPSGVLTGVISVLDILRHLSGTDTSATAAAAGL
jgi:CBS domain-containing protein